MFDVTWDLVVILAVIGLITVVRIVGDVLGALSVRTAPPKAKKGGLLDW